MLIKLEIKVNILKKNDNNKYDFEWQKKNTTKNKEENFQIILFVKKMSIYLHIKRESTSLAITKLG